MKKTIYVFIVFLIFSVLSCKSYLADSIDDYIGLLPADNSVYISMNSAGESDLCLFFISKYVQLDKQSTKMLSKTERIYTGLKSSKSNTYFDLVTKGSFPRTTANIAFCGSKEWEKLDTDIKSWRNRISGMQMSVLSNDLLFASSGDISSIFSAFNTHKANKFRKDLKDIFDTSDLVFFIPETGKDKLSSINLGSKNKIIKSVLALVNKKNDRYELAMEIVLENADDARGMKSILRTFLMGIIRKFGKTELKRFRENSKLETINNKVVISNIEFLPDNLKVFLSEMFFREGVSE